MLKASHTTLIVFSGLIWLAVGCFLLSLGINFIVTSILRENLATIHRPLLDPIAPYVGGVEPAALVLVAFCLLIGYLKGRYVFANVVNKGVTRILSLPNPVSFGKVYTKKYYILLGSMILLGFLMRFTSLDIRGGVDIAIGFALINGALLYFIQAFYLYRKPHKVSIK